MSSDSDSDANYDTSNEESDYEKYVSPNDLCEEDESNPAWEKAEKLRELREDLDLEDEDDRLDFLDDLDFFVYYWKKEFPDLQPIFSPKEIDLLLSDAAKHKPFFKDAQFIKFVSRTGYKDGLVVPSERRITALHHAARLERHSVVPYLFRIYDRFDVDYRDESGLTHFHVACMTKGCREAVRKFLQGGKVDPNQVWPETGDSPLHLALKHERSNEVPAMLLRAGADRGLANRAGSTPLHAVVRTNRFIILNVAKTFFRAAASTEEQVWIDAKDASGDTALHSVLRSLECPDVKKLAELILRNGADPNLANEEGSTPLHLICKRDQDTSGLGGRRVHRHEFAEMLFDVAEEKKRPVQVDAKDELGRTPLHCAVVKSLVDLVDVLLKRGVDASNFVYPTADQFDESLAKEKVDGYARLCFQFKLVTGLLCVVERLEEGGFRLQRSSASTIMRLFARHGVFEIRDDLVRRWVDDDDADLDLIEESRAKKIEEVKAKEIGATTLYDLMLVSPGRRADELIARRDYYDLVRDDDRWRWELAECFEHPCEMAARKFFRGWALDPFCELIGYRLPMVCCAMIVDNPKNEDLYRICLAGTSQS